MAELSPRGERLRRELLRLRDLAGLSTRKLAEAMKVDRGKVWRVEKGQQLPPMPLVRSWLGACGADVVDRERVLDLAEAVHGETRSWGDLLAGVTHLQGVAREREQPPGLVRNFQPTIVPALLQTPEYAARIIPLADHTGSIDHDAALAERLRRQQRLYEEGHRFQFLLIESVLRWSARLGEIGPAQLDRIVSLARLGNVDVAAVPAGGDVVAPWHNFVIWEPDGEDAYVTTELFHGEQRIGDSDQVELYRGLWKRMWSAAAVGDDAVALIRAMTEG